MKKIDLGREEGGGEEGGVGQIGEAKKKKRKSTKKKKNLNFYLINYFNIFNDTWRPIIVHMGATSSLNGRINSLTNGCMRLSQN